MSKNEILITQGHTICYKQCLKNEEKVKTLTSKARYLATDIHGQKNY